METRKGKGGPEVGAYRYTIQISTFDCTGCEICVESCPDDSLFMENFEIVKNSSANDHWEYCYNLPHTKNPLDKFTVKGS